MGFFHHPPKRPWAKIVIISLICAFLAYTFYLLPKKSYAEEVFLYPEACTGTWTYSQLVAGEKFPNQSYPGARSTASGDNISCFNFTGNLPPDSTIISATVSFLWGNIDPEYRMPAPSIEESYDVAPISGPDIISDTVVPEVIEPATEVIEPAVEPMSWLRQFVPIARAQGEETVVEVVPEPEMRKLEVIEVPTEEKETKILETEESNKEISPAVDDLEEAAEATKEVMPSAETSPHPVTVDEALPSSDTEHATALFDVSYQLGDSPAQSLGLLYQENLSATFGVPVTLETLPDLSISLVSRLSLDSVAQMELEGVRLTITYSNEEIEDPFRQPNFEVDKVIDTLQAGKYEAIRIQRGDNKEHEIWYRELSEFGLTEKNSSEEEKINIHTTEETMLQERKDFYWNFVAGEELVNEVLPIALQDSHIFWFNSKGDILYVYSILTQGINSQSFSPQDENITISYFGPAKQEKKAVYDKQTLTFSFSDVAL